MLRAQASAGRCPFTPLTNAVTLTADAETSIALLTSSTAIPPYSIARKSLPNATARPEHRVPASSLNHDTARATLAIELDAALTRALPTPAPTEIDTLALVSAPIAASTVAAVAPDLPAPDRARLAEAVLTWIDTLAPLISAGRPARRLSRTARTERRARAALTALLTEHDLPEHTAATLAAGTQVPAAAAAWLLTLLARHTRAAAAARAGEPGWLDAIVWETLRLYPPTWQLPRIITADTDIAGQLLPLGQQVLVSPFALGRDPRYSPSSPPGINPHHDTVITGITDTDRPATENADPEDADRRDRHLFVPERWLDGTRPGDWLPFGAGPRSCPGRSLALTQLRHIAAAVTAAADLTATGALHIDARRGLMPDPRTITATARP